MVACVLHLHEQGASFETRPCGALLRMRGSLYGIREDSLMLSLSKHERTILALRQAQGEDRGVAAERG